MLALITRTVEASLIGVFYRALNTSNYQYLRMDLRGNVDDIEDKRNERSIIT